MKRTMVGVFLLVASPLLLYLLSSLIVLDFCAVAYPGDEDNTATGQPVAIGPKPRRLFCRPTVHDINFIGDEWPFRVYAPLCRVWRSVRGFAPPAEERSHP
jgi:hypothetical protein